MQARSAWGVCAGCGGDGWGMQKENLERTNMLLLLLLASETRPYVISQGRRFDQYEWLDDLGNHYWAKLRVSFSAQHMQPVKSLLAEPDAFYFVNRTHAGMEDECDLESWIYRLESAWGLYAG